MSESCSGNCSSCGSNCDERKAESLLAQLNPKSSVKKVIAVVSGKGGVGKSTVTAQLAVAMARKGYRVGVLDADITGPSMPKAFGVNECAGADQAGLYPAVTASGIQVMSINLLLDNDTDPVLWRGPVIAGAVKLHPEIVGNFFQGTTRWLMGDPNSNMKKIMDCISSEIPIIYVNVDYSDSPYEGLQAYEWGFIKEGVGCGGASVGAIIESSGRITCQDLEDKVHEIYKGIMGFE